MGAAQRTAAQCINLAQWGSISAPTNASPALISTCNWLNEYSIVTNIVAGQTYAINNSCGGFITVRQGAYNGAAVAWGNAPLTFVAPANGTYYFHWNTNAACGTSTGTCCTTTITCVSCSGGGCPGGQIADCNGNCAPANWQGDGECDSGQYTFNGIPIVFNCAELDWDNGDCAGAAAPCCSGHVGGGCADAACTAVICADDFFCCWLGWDALCAAAAIANANAGGACAGVTDCPGSPPAPTCCQAHGGTGCPDAACSAVVCAVDPTCCSVVWDAVCAGFAIANASSGGACSGVSNCPAEGQCAPGLGGAAFPGSGSIQLYQDMTPTQLITDVFLGDCLTASGITYTGATTAVGRFTNGWGIGIESGIVLTTGLASNITGPNNTGGGFYTANGTPGLNLLTNLAGVTTYDAAHFRFNFIPETESVTFTYVFASEEYPEWVCAGVNDVFGFFVSGPGYAANTNIATIPGTTTAVAIDHVNNNGLCAPNYPAYYVSNTGGPHNQYDGFTLPLTACINTVPCETYTITLAIADAGDDVYDSAVFLAAESFSAGVDVGITAEDEGGATSGAENCGENGCFVFTLEQALPQDLTLNYTVQHNGNGQFFDPIPVTVFFPAGTTTATVCIAAIPGTMGEELNSVEIVLDTSQSPMLGCSCATGGELVESILYFCDPATVLPVTWLDFQAEADALRDVVDCTWQTATEQDNSHFLVQRSTDMESWTAVGTVPGAGTSQLPLHYGFTDPAPLPGVSYYRIMQVDIGGGMSPSVVRRVQFGGGTRLFVHPNPGTNIFHLSGHEGGTLTMLDVRGRQVPFILTPGGELSLPGAAAGTYIAEVRWDHARDPERIRIMVR